VTINGLQTVITWAVMEIFASSDFSGHCTCMLCHHAVM